MRAASTTIRTLFAAGLLFATEVPTLAQKHPIILARDQTILGSGDVKNINLLSITNEGFYFAMVSTTNVSIANLAIVLNGFLALPENTSVGNPVDAVIEDFPSLDSNSSGYVGIILNLRGTGVSNADDYGVFWNTTLLAREASPIFATDVNGTSFANPPTYWAFYQTHFNQNNQFLVTGEIQDTSIGTPSQREFSLVLLDTDGAGTVVNEEILLMEGYPLPATGEIVKTVGTSGHPNSTAFNTKGDWMSVAQAGTSPATDSMILHNHQIIAREGSLGVDEVRNWINMTTSKLSLNDFGDTLHTGLLQGGGPNNAVIVLNGEIFAQEGETFPAIAPDVILNFGANPPIYVSNSGDVYWSGTTSSGTRNTYYFRNKEVVLRQGDPVGSTLARTLWSSAYAYDVSRSGRFFLGKVTQSNGGEALFLADYGAIVPIPGCYSNPSTLTKVSGEAQVGNTFTLEMDNAQGPGVLPRMFWSLQQSIPGNECGKTTKFGEVLVSLAAGNIIATIDAPLYMGSPSQFTIDIPNDPILVDLTVYGQGAFLNFSQAAPGPNVQLTNGYRIEVGL